LVCGCKTKHPMSKNHWFVAARQNHPMSKGEDAKTTLVRVTRGRFFEHFFSGNF
jgi:hypothetical protein